MIYQIEFKPQALKDLRSIDKGEVRRVMEKIEVMENDSRGDVKRLTNFTPEYRLRVGSYRVLFEVEGEKVVIYRVRHRKDAYS
jgi:mRNA interferase RelE/StbE